jgi:ring-1,2-phenylacetyl-CoA epoxidase subunit PaaC
MKEEIKHALKGYFLAAGDDELILGHRNSEWCGHAPILEEDIAFANIALDEIGHASLWYTIVADIENKDRDEYPDRLVYFRNPGEYRNIQMVELHNGDFAFSMLRQYLFDIYEMVHLGLLSKSEYTPAADIAAKVRKEEVYHTRHCRAWIRRLGLGTEESNHRLQKALDNLWPYTLQLFLPMERESQLIDAGFVPGAAVVQNEWESEVFSFLEECSLVIPDAPRLKADRSEHTPHLKVLLTEMQLLARSEPEAEW